MLCLPPHTTHESQPLDCGVFKPLKSKWTAVCHTYFQKHPGKVIMRFNFNMLFSQAWLKSLIPSNIIAGFFHNSNCNHINSSIKTIFEVLIYSHILLFETIFLLLNTKLQDDSIVRAELT